MQSQAILKEATNLAPQITEYRRWLHANPETGMNLPETLAYVKSSLEAMGIQPSFCGKCLL